MKDNRFPRILLLVIYAIHVIYNFYIISNTSNVINALVLLAVAGVSLKQYRRAYIKFYKTRFI